MSVGQASSRAAWVSGAALVVIAAAVALTPPPHRPLVAGLAIAGFAVSLALDVLAGGHTRPAAVRAALPSAGSAVAHTIQPSPWTPAPALEGAEDAAPARLRVSTFSRQKVGNASGENEDSFAFDADRGVAAISDGASSSVSAREWSRALTSDFVRSAPAITGDGIRSLLRSTARTFMEAPLDTTGWWGADAARSGSFATFLGLRVSREADRVAWAAAAIGDSVVIQLRVEPSGPRLVEGFPLESSGGFAGTPSLVGSTQAQEGRLPALRLATGSASLDDCWLLLTDELAKWALGRDEAGREVWSLLLGASDSDLDLAIDSALATGEMENDDMTLVRIAVR
jgi:hypothetical protein